MSDDNPVVPPCCSCGGETTPPAPAPAAPLGPGAAANPVPLSNGFNIPTLGVIRGFNRFYTRALYLNPEDIPAPSVDPAPETPVANT